MTVSPMAIAHCRQHHRSAMQTVGGGGQTKPPGLPSRQVVISLQKRAGVDSLKIQIIKIMWRTGKRTAQSPRCLPRPALSLVAAVAVTPSPPPPLLRRQTRADRPDPLRWRPARRPVLKH